VRLGRVLEQQEAAPPRHRLQAVHVAHLPVEVHGEDRGRPLPDGALGRGGVDQAGAGVDVAEHRHRARMDEAEGGGDEGVCGDDHLVARADPGRQSGDRERRGAGGDAYAVAHPAVGGELVLEPCHLLAEDVRAGAEDAFEGRVQLGCDRLVLACEVDEWDRGSHRCPGRSGSGTVHPCSATATPAWHANTSIWTALPLSKRR
jgi:hypothetical protein